MVKATMPSILNTIRIIYTRLYSSLTTELKIRFVGLVVKKLFTHDKFQLKLLIVSITKPYVDGCCLGFYLFLAV